LRLARRTIDKKGYQLCEAFGVHQPQRIIQIGCGIALAEVPPNESNPGNKPLQRVPLASRNVPA
jgi:hypothetical protein